MTRYCLHEMERLEVDKEYTQKSKEWLFFTYWTLKEAALKALGEGLSTPLTRLYMIKHTKHKWELNHNSSLPKELKSLQLRSFQIEKSYQLAIAVQMSQAFRSNHELTVSITDANSSDSSCWNTAVFTS